MSSTKIPFAINKATNRKATKTRSVGRPKKPVPLPAVPVTKTLVTIHPDGIITVEKTKTTVTEQVMTKAIPNKDLIFCLCLMPPVSGLEAYFTQKIHPMLEPTIEYLIDKTAFTVFFLIVLWIVYK